MTPILASAATATGKAAGQAAMIAIDAGIRMLSDMPHGGNLVSYAQAGSVIPTCLVDESCATSELLPDTLQTLQAVYAGYYLRAFSMHNISIGGSSAYERLDKFSTNRQPGGALIGAALGRARSVTGLEDFQDRLPTMDDLASDLPEDLEELEAEGLRIEQEALAMMQVATEAIALPGQIQAGAKNAPRANNAQSTSGKNTVQKDDDKKVKDSIGFEKSVDVSAPVNMGVGLTVNVKITDNGNSVTIPVNIRLNAMYMSPDPMVSILGFSSSDISFGARYKKWRLGGIDFWRDLVMAQDLIDEHKKNLKADKTGIYLQMMNRRRQNNFAAAMSASLSANNASNIMVLSEETAAALEVKAGGRLSDFRFRERIFSQGYGMLLAVISQRRGYVRFYTRGIPEHTDVSERDMKSVSKGSGPDVGDILSAFRAGSSFRL